ncbi:metalloregulator ArsR/SmtB family transcription factor [Vibrio hangzhouensis]|uniref:metalloregulator ArsR/SmtB family transcription factor n=1 Tax=Vibrio hangzhouensis TaxID=462991 RepID=UPI001C971337|nr:metalloregulator ArsR/SmtB family transcription factor [Vibrio hangzhouensis]MBY6198579.1 metalloregulator ArsR/SmtB family transcription factor [Vibrio hangzhouensis]
MTKKILFVCRGNSARSQLAEAIVNRDYAPAYQAFSAGSSPGHVDSRTLSTLENADFTVDALRSKSVDEFSDVQFDYVITLCSSAQRECGVFENCRESLFWDLPSPTSLSEQTFEASLYDLQKRIDLFVTVHNENNDLEFDPLVLHKCLSDHTRLLITLMIFTEVELSVGELCDALQEPQPKVSRALAVLRNCGVVTDRRKGQWAFYSIADQLPLWGIDILDASVKSMKAPILAANQLLNQSQNRPDKHG